MKLYGVRVFVDDIDISTRFYRDVLGLKVNWSMGEMQAAGFDLGNAELIIEQAARDGADGDLVGRFAGVSLQVEDIEKTHADWQAGGVEFTQAPQAQPWGGTLAHFKDPSGNILTLLG